jgi:GT2 family glycosyltransferase
MQTSPRVWILILNWNGAADTIACLQSVFALDYTSYGVVVCDNGSTDDSLDAIREWADRGAVSSAGNDRDLPSAVRARPPIRVVTYDRSTAELGGRPDDAEVRLILIETGGNLGFAGGNNVGLRYLLARPDVDYVWLLNNDTVVARSALRELVSRAESDPDAGAVGGTLLELSHPDRVQEMGGATVSEWHGMVSVLGRGVPSDAVRPTEPELDYISGGCLLVRREIIEQIGLLDERFFLYGEDVDWGLRMRDAGLALLYAPHAHVWHKGSGSVKRGHVKRSSANHDYHNLRGALLLVHKRHPARIPVAVLYTGLRVGLPRLLRGEWHRITALLRAYGDLMRRVLGASARGEGPNSRRGGDGARVGINEAAS